MKLGDTLIRDMVALFNLMSSSKPITKDIRIELCSRLVTSSKHNQNSLSLYLYLIIQNLHLNRPRTRVTSRIKRLQPLLLFPNPQI